ncbi:MAG: hypothetical protein P8130_01500, partial [Deltaproteobacteria bacterium]
TVSSQGPENSSQGPDSLLILSAATYWQHIADHHTIRPNRILQLFLRTGVLKTQTLSRADYFPPFDNPLSSKFQLIFIKNDNDYSGYETHVWVT